MQGVRFQAGGLHSSGCCQISELENKYIIGAGERRCQRRGGVRIARDPFRRATLRRTGLSPIFAVFSARPADILNQRGRGEGGRRSEREKERQTGRQTKTATEGQRDKEKERQRAGKPPPILCVGGDKLPLPPPSGCAEDDQVLAASSPYPCPKEPAALPLRPAQAPLLPVQAGRLGGECGGDSATRSPPHPCPKEPAALRLCAAGCRRRHGAAGCTRRVECSRPSPCARSRVSPCARSRRHGVECSRPRVHAPVRVGRGLSASLRRKGRAPLLSVRRRVGGGHGGECGGDSEDAAQRGPKSQAALPLRRRGAAVDGPRSSLCAGDSAESTAERLAGGYGGDSAKTRWRLGGREYVPLARLFPVPVRPRVPAPLRIFS